jgi:hypothetical protein
VKATSWFRLALHFLPLSFVILLALDCLSSRAAAQTCSPPNCWTGNFYQYEIVAQTGESVQVGQIQGQLTGFGVAPSINENGNVAFDGQVSNNSQSLGDTLFMGTAGSSALTAVSLVLSPNISFDDAVQINDTNQIVSVREVQGPSYHLDVWDGNNPGTFTDVADSGEEYAAILTYPGINSSNTVFFNAFDQKFNLLLAAAPPLKNQSLKPAQPEIRPMISDANSIVLRDGNTDQSPIVMYAFNNGKFSKQVTIADTTEFSLLGRSPGISRDGSVVVFAGDLTASGRWDMDTGPGIFAAVMQYNKKTGRPTVKYTMRVAGFHYGGVDGMKHIAFVKLGGANFLAEGSPWCDKDPCFAGGELEDLPPLSSPKPVFFNTFTEAGFKNSTEWENRIAVAHTDFGAKGSIEGDTIVVSFLATPTMDDSTGLGLFSAMPGLWTVRADLFLNQKGLFSHVYRPVPVTQIGSSLGSTGLTVTDLGVSDPLAREKFNAEANGDHRLGFWVCTQAGGCPTNLPTSQVILRATYIQQYGASGQNPADLKLKHCKVPNCLTGTMGALVNDSAGTNLILSNDHVFGEPKSATKNGAKPSAPISEPGPFDYSCERATTVAGFWAAPPLISGVDAAVASLSSGQINTTGQIYNIGIPAGTTTVATPGMRVAKQGRTTGLTCSTVKYLMDFENGYARCGQKPFRVNFKNQIFIHQFLAKSSSVDPFALTGDSGSLVVSADTAQPVALLFAAGQDNGDHEQVAAANPIDDVASTLGVSFVGGAQHPVAGCHFSAPEVILSAQETERVRLVKDKYEAQLFQDPAVTGVGVGAADDNPTEGVVVVMVEAGKSYRPVPQTLDGIRTQTVFGGPFKPLEEPDCSGKHQTFNNSPR